MITPEPKAEDIRCCLGTSELLKKWRNKGSSKRGLRGASICLREEILTTAGAALLTALAYDKTWVLPNRKKCDSCWPKVNRSSGTNKMVPKPTSKPKTTGCKKYRVSVFTVSSNQLFALDVLVSSSVSFNPKLSLKVPSEPGVFGAQSFGA